MRASTPAARAFVHLNHASTSLPDERVFLAQSSYLELEAQIGTHRAAARLQAQLDEVPAKAAGLVEGQPHQVAFVGSASLGFASTLSAVAPDQPLEVFVSRHEWASNLMCVAAMRRASIRVVEHESSRSWAESFALAMVRREADSVPVLSVPLISSHSGVVNDLAGLDRIALENGGWLFVDASQAVGQRAVNMRSLNADVLSFPARKWLRGPRGIAVVVLSDRALASFGASWASDIHGSCWSREAGLTRPRHSSAGRFQPYGLHPGLVLGLGAAVDVLRDHGIEHVHKRVLERAAALRHRLRQVKQVCEADDDGGSGIVCMQVDPPSHGTADEVVRELWARGVNAAAVGERYAPLQMAGLPSLLRLSVHAFTTDDEIELAAATLDEVLRTTGA